MDMGNRLKCNQTTEELLLCSCDRYRNKCEGENNITECHDVLPTSLVRSTTTNPTSWIAGNVNLRDNSGAT
ncbi:hypothetical protein SARC_16836, partial [Sphaeroforma arctica JP610]